MPVTVRIPAPLRPVTGGAAAVECAPGTVRELIDQLDAQHAGFRDRVMEDGSLRRFVNVFVAGEDVRFGDGVDTAVAEGQEVTILPAVAGGSAP
jgi:sulfur-carrier protein